MADSNNITVTLPWLSLLGVLFVALKLLDKIAWSWFWVLAPFWAPVMLVIFFWLLFIVLAIVFGGGR